MNDLASRLRAHPENDLSLAVGAVALAAGVGVAFGRMEGPWDDFPLFLLLAIPCAALFCIALAPRADGGSVGTRPDGGLAHWQTACLLIAFPLLLGSIVQLTQVLGKDEVGSGTATWILVLLGLCATSISYRFQSPGATIIAALFFATAGMTAVNWIDSDAGVSAYRDVLLAEGVAFLLAARLLWDARREDAKVLVAISGAVLIAGAVLGNEISFGLFEGGLSFDSKDGWEMVLIVVSIGLLAFAAWQRHGGSAFIGAFGTFAFVGLAAADESSLAGWPLLLSLVSLGCVAWSLVLRPNRTTSGPK